MKSVLAGLFTLAAMSAYAADAPVPLTIEVTTPLFWVARGGETPRPIWNTPPTEKDPTCAKCQQTTLLDVIKEAEEVNLPGDTPVPAQGQQQVAPDAMAKASSAAMARMGLVERLGASEKPTVSPGELAQIIKRIKIRYFTTQPEVAYQSVKLLDPRDRDLTGSVDP